MINHLPHVISLSILKPFTNSVTKCESNIFKSLLVDLMEKCLLHGFHQCWHCMMKCGLLDEQDIELLENEDDHSGDKARQHGAVQQQHLLLSAIAIVVPSVVAVIATKGWVCRCSTLSVFLLRFVSAALFVFLFIFALLFLLLLLLLPRLFCWLWTRQVDDRFRHFVLALRQRELALFGLRHFSPPSSQLHVPFRAQRVQCLRQLCHFVRAFNSASARLVLTSNERDNLLFNFVGDEMRTLCGDDRSETDIVADDNDLQINSLKSLWQYHFLVRSEFIRCALLALRQDFCQRKCLAFCRNLALVLNTVRMTTASLPVYTGYSGSSKTAMRTKIADRHLAMSRASICRAQLEWALERLQMASSLDGSGGDSTWPPPLDVVRCVEQVAVTLRHALTECQQQQQQSQSLPEHSDASPAALQTENGDASLAKQCQAAEHQQQQMMRTEEEDDEDYQIFELDIGQSLVDNDTTRTGKRRTAAEEEDELFDDGANSGGVVLAHDAMLRELGAALTLRKEQCLRRERRALARARGVPDEAVPADELDRTPFGAGCDGSVAATAAPCHQATGAVKTRDATSVVTPPNQALLMPSADAVAAQRAAILGGGGSDRMALQQHEMEQFGDDDADGEAGQK